MKISGILAFWRIERVRMEWTIDRSKERVVGH